MNLHARAVPGAVRVLALAAVVLGLPPAIAADDVSRAEALLFATDHLRGLAAAGVLRYDFRKRGSLEAGFDDTVEIRVGPAAPDGTRDVSTRYLSGERRKRFPPVAGARSNPVLMYFLERDIQEMERLTGGNRGYFRRRIRAALAGEARVRPMTIRHDRRALPGREIRIAPYVDDPRRSRYATFADKYYVFTLSDRIPGGVYRIRAVTLAAGAGTNLIEEDLTFNAQRDAPGASPPHGEIPARPEKGK